MGTVKADPDSKDRRRIQDIWNKAKGDLGLMITLAVRQSKSIKDVVKAVRRGGAAEQHREPTVNKVISQIFLSRAQEIQGQGRLFNPMGDLEWIKDLKRTVSKRATGKQAKIAALETRIAKLQSKVGANYKRKRVYIDGRGKHTLMDFRADTGQAKMLGPDIKNVLSNFAGDVDKTIRGILKHAQNVVYSRPSIESYNHQLGTLITVNWKDTPEKWMDDQFEFEDVMSALKKAGWQVTIK